MTASDHLKHRTGSLDGDQIPEDLKRYHADAKKGLAENESWKDCFVAELIERIAKAEAALAQKTRECEDKHAALAEWKADFAALEDSQYRAVMQNEELRAQVEQLGRQVAEMSSELQWIADQDQYTFAECTLAEEIMGRIRRCLELASRARTK